MPAIRFLLCSFCTLLLSVNTVAEQQRQLTISMVSDLETHAFASKILFSAYEMLGIEVTFKALPAKRSLAEAGNGQTDGEVARIAGIAELFPELIQVPFPVTQIRAYAFGKQKELVVDDWTDLAELRIGILRGVLYSEIGTEGMNREFFENYSDMLQLLASDRIDVAIGVLEQTRQILDANHPDVDIHSLGQPIYEADLFHYIHQRHQDMVEPLSQALQALSESGQIEEIYNQHYQLDDAD